MGIIKEKTQDRQQKISKSTQLTFEQAVAKKNNVVPVELREARISRKVHRKQKIKIRVLTSFVEYLEFVHSFLSKKWLWLVSDSRQILRKFLGLTNCI